MASPPWVSEECIKIWAEREVVRNGSPSLPASSSDRRGRRSALMKIKGLMSQSE
jgi:IMP cyclohydrolase